MTAMTGQPRTQRPRQAILGQLPRIHRADGSPIRVLLVDDEPALTNLVKMALHYEGWDVEIAHNGREAIAKFERISPDVLVLDIMLPDVDGLQILQRVRESDDYTPTLFLTARDSVMDRVTGLTAGADDYMTKPFSLEELVARLRGLLRRSSHLAPRPTSPSKWATSSSTPPAGKSPAAERRYRCRRPSSNCCGS
ncbi:putative transcriptional regulatory protein TcrX [Mycobacterium kansasii]|uniref:Putative transcriptional regulatory protein TcrX n=1 Tax=Mycobacterium kansasii TaxID=1768 RepID=A0A1V3XGF0_MYCKA|nr:putative transcriptional regulatory protein TcrX [Mycobacterium kansasii]